MTRKKKKKFNPESLTSKSLEQLVTKIFKFNPKRRFDLKQVGHQLSIEYSQHVLEACLEKMLKDKLIVEVKPGKYSWSQSVEPVEKGWHVITGTVDMTRLGAAYIISEHLGKDIYVPPTKIGNALDKDTVRVKWRLTSRGNPEGVVVEVIDRHAETFVGVFRARGKKYIVQPDKINMSIPIIVPADKIKTAEEGDKVVVKITDWHDGQKVMHPSGEITVVLGKEGTSNIEMISILMKYGFGEEFSDEVMKENDLIPETIPADEIARRRDFRDVTTFTIDPETAKDFDDALSHGVLDNGNIEVGVHIADVTYYVKQGSALDKEAFKRSTSVYLVDRVAPMLPEKLSNGVCSLRPNEDKLCFSAVFEFTPEGKIVKKWFGKTIIHSDRRFTYEEAQKVIETGEGDFAEELLQLNAMAKKMRKERLKIGAINFEAPEVYFRLDPEGKPLEVHTKERKDAHLLIEDFMLLANKEVAGKIFNVVKEGHQAIPFIYRIHDLPNMEKLVEFAKFASQFGYKVDMSNPKNVSKALNKLMKEAEGKDEAAMFTQIAIRSMAKAAYSTDNIGHYGLAFEHYSHFTSPIRRYADVIAHRLLEKNLDEKVYRASKDGLEEQCKHISIQERKAMEAERESVKYKQVEFMMQHRGQTFDGVIVGIADHGIFVEIKDSHCEGRVTFDQMPEPFNVEPFRIIGRRTGKVFRLGDTVRVKVKTADLQRRQIDLTLME